MAATLKFNQNGKFRILLMGDPHEYYTPSRGVDKRTKDFLVLENMAIDELQPDLVVYMGDNTHADTPQALRASVERITRPITGRNLPLGIVFGNHDFEAKVSDPWEYINAYRAYENSLFPAKDDALSGRYDYHAVIRSSDGSRDAFNLWFMYSGNRAPKESCSKYDYVRPEQIAWYEKTAARLKADNGGTPVPAILFQHIPVPEEYELFDEVPAWRLPFDALRGQDERDNKCYKLKKGVAGFAGEAPCAPSVNSGQFDSWLRTGDVKAAFFGHDHMNDFAGDVRGITLGQCKLSGFHPYGDGTRQGVRVIDLDESAPDRFVTYMRYYRELVGDRCQSITGPERLMHDRTSMTLEFCLKAFGTAAAAAALGAAGAAVSHKIKKLKQ